MPQAADTRATERVWTIDALTGMRAFCALAVLVLHVREPLLALLPASAAIDPWIRSGRFGVDAFFVLSGFVISHNYARRLGGPSRPGRREILGYLIARFARIYPAYLVAFALMVVVVWLALDPREFTGPGFVTSLFLIQPLPGVEVWNGPTWSVGCEVLAYALFPLAAVALMRMRRRTAVVLAVCLTVALVLAVRAMFATDGGFPFVAYFWVRVFVGFPLGCLMWVVWHRRGRGTSSGPGWDAVAVAALVSIALVTFSEGQGPRSYLSVGLLGLVVLAVASATGVIRRLLSSRPVVWGGKVSFSVYLVHYPLYLILFALLPAEEHLASPLVARIGIVAVPIAVAVAVGAVLHGVVEEPVRRRIRRGWAARNDASPATVPIAPRTAANAATDVPERS